MANVFSGDLSKLDNPTRRQILPQGPIIEQMGIHPGQSIADIGCGTGYFSIPLTRVVGPGKVYAMDIAERMLDEMRARTRGMTNIEIVDISEGYPEIEVDHILLSHVLHEVEDPKEFLKSCMDILKKGGYLHIIDWQKKDTGMGPPVGHRLAKEGVIKIIGKHLERQIHEYFYFLTVRR